MSDAPKTKDVIWPFVVTLAVTGLIGVAMEVAFGPLPDRAQTAQGLMLAAILFWTIKAAKQ